MTQPVYADIFEEVFTLCTPMSVSEELPQIREGGVYAWLCLHLTEDAFVEGTVYKNIADRGHIHIEVKGANANHMVPGNAAQILKPAIMDAIQRALLRYKLEGGG